MSSYLGSTPEAQKAYKRRAVKLGLKLPTAAESEALGVKLRAHGPRKNKVVRKRSVKEVKAIQRKTGAEEVKAKKSVSAPVAGKAQKAAGKSPAKTASPATPRRRKTDFPAAVPVVESTPVAVTAARASKAPPALPPPPLPPLANSL